MKYHQPIGSRPYEKCGRQVTVTGWACDSCGMFFGNKDGAENMARWCCASDIPCAEPGCAGRTNSIYTVCEPCKSKRDLAKFLAAPRVDWDGETPLFDGDKFLADADAVATHFYDLDNEDRQGVRFEIAKPNYGPRFEMVEFLSDFLPEDFEPTLSCREAEHEVNEWIDSSGPFSWSGSGKYATAESLRKHAGIDIGGTQ